MAAKGRILSVSYDEALLRTRHMLLEREGYDVTSTRGFIATLEECQKGNFAVFILGHSIANSEKKQMVTIFKQFCPAPVISLRRNAGEEIVEGADYHIQAEPERLLKLVAEVIRGNAAAAQ
jgi:DNA-binding NtrC family response regulator